MRCRSCGSTRFAEVVDLGEMPLVNNLLRSSDAPCPRWPLAVQTCLECSLAQLTESPPPEDMFVDYLYESRFSATMLDHARKLVERFVRAGARVVEVASNDGYLLAQAQQAGATVLGIDPARRIAAEAVARGVPTRCEFFTAELAQKLRAEGIQADVLFANNVLAHVPDPNELAGGFAVLLHEEGIAHVEVPYLAPMLELGAFDTIYHEHQCYFSVSALRTLFERHGLGLVQVSEIPIHGGSLHVQLAHRRTTTAVAEWCERERQAGFFSADRYTEFANLVEKRRTDLLLTLDDFDSVAAYGAAAKGIVLLNVFELGPDRVRFVVDRNPEKQGRFVPGTGQEISAPERLLNERPEACIILPWNIQDEIIQQNEDYQAAGGHFITPLPDLRVI